jgi:sulfatase modifying factor 1
MARLPGGRFKMGARGDPVAVAPFFLDQTEVSVQAYGDCVRAKKCTAPDTGQFCNWERPDRANHPVNCVDWKQAIAYCAAAGKRLPTEEEWEWAARGAERGTTWPWGNDAPRDQLCWNGGTTKRYSRREGLGTCPIGSFPAGNNPQGLMDMAGNVVEWTSSPYDSSTRVYRGGCWGDDASALFAAANRAGYDPDDETGGIGFRCARGAP